MPQTRSKVQKATPRPILQNKVPSPRKKAVKAKLFDWYLLDESDCNSWHVKVGGRTELQNFQTTRITDRVSPRLVETTNSLYELKGHMDQEKTKLNGFGHTVVSMFHSGFPANFMKLLRDDWRERYNLDSEDELSRDLQAPRTSYSPVKKPSIPVVPSIVVTLANNGLDIPASPECMLPLKETNIAKDISSETDDSGGDSDEASAVGGDGKLPDVIKEEGAQEEPYAGLQVEQAAADTAHVNFGSGDHAGVKEKSSAIVEESSTPRALRFRRAAAERPATELRVPAKSPKTRRVAGTVHKPKSAKSPGLPSSFVVKTTGGMRMVVSPDDMSENLENKEPPSKIPKAPPRKMPPSLAAEIEEPCTSVEELKPIVKPLSFRPNLSSKNHPKTQQKRTVKWYSNAITAMTDASSGSKSKSQAASLLFKKKISSENVDDPLPAVDWGEEISVKSDFEPVSHQDTTKTFRMSVARNPNFRRRRSTLFNPSNAAAASERLNFAGFLLNDKQRKMKRSRKVMDLSEKSGLPSFSMPRLPGAVEEENLSSSEFTDDDGEEC